MKTFLLLSFLTLVLLLLQCKNSEPDLGERSLLEVNSVLDSTQVKFIEFAKQTRGNPLVAIGLTTAWLQSQPNVQFAGTFDSLSIDIELKSGLSTYFCFETVDENGFSIFRGGGKNEGQGKNTLAACQHPTPNTITNKKVLLFAADTKSLPGANAQATKTYNTLINSGLGFEVTLLKDDQCSYGVVEHFGDYGMVIISTHGQKDGFMVGSTLDLANPPNTEADLKAEINAQLDGGTYDKLIAGDIKMAVSVQANPLDPDWMYKFLFPVTKRRLFLSSEFINALPQMPNTIIFGNMCFSGMGSNMYEGSKLFDGIPIRTAFLNRNPISYYCYVRTDHSETLSFQVRDDFAAEMEDKLVKRLVEELDCSGHAHLRPSDDAEYFDVLAEQVWNAEYHKPWSFILLLKQYGHEDYSYEGCTKTFTDVRDGHIYKSVCISEQTWMAENLVYDAPESECYDELSSNCEIYGKLYSRLTVMNGESPSNTNPSGVQGICPNGWHLPSDLEWKQLFDAVGGYVIAGKALKSSSNLWTTATGPGTNSSGFSALPGGEWVYTNSTTVKTYQTLGIHALFHTSSQDDPNIIENVMMVNTDDVVSFLFRQPPWPQFPDVLQGNVSCRCVKDK